ncbi:unnamed protein product [Dibothriocephalus latus]|uniref:GPI ethanolamine phosphate transferase 1 n=1 Tax=Dibothriocephalus latus TaxID=60516 RepID=A0A3P6V2K1_DIBLA|nr:unnamed protein product [Dibothriocephalus latus]
MLGALPNITREYGISGVVKANSPAESRPRHTAIFAGFEEDIANIKSGWSKSVQPFESVFNNVGASWAFGIETVLNYFDANIRRMSHGNSLSDFQVLQAFLTSADRVVQELSVQKNDVNGSACGKIVFLHFDSTDHAGHVSGYPSPGYVKAVVEADNFAQSVFDFFRKNIPQELMNATTFIVTSDHGVSEYGHGGGSLNEVYVPIFMWGSGIVGEQFHPVLRKPDSKSGYPILLNQIDICPLLASLLGIKMPSNSMATIERIKSTSFFPFLVSGGEEPRVVQDLLEETNQLVRTLSKLRNMNSFPRSMSIGKHKIV